MTEALQALIRQAGTELGSDACRAGRHTWVSDGGRACPHDLTDRCSQAVYTCSVCGDTDYGEPGGPGDADCERHCVHRVERAARLYHRLLLRTLRRQPKPKLP